MTTQVLNKIARKYKINLDWYTHVWGWLNQKSTYIFVEFSTIEVVGGTQYFFNKKTIRIRFADVLKREEYDDDYYTNGNQWISEIR